jgi:hypothetical protein
MELPAGSQPIAPTLDEEARSPLLAWRHVRGASLRQLLYAESTLQWLPDRASSWCQGGCLVLAQALCALVNEEMLVVASGRGPEHVVVQMGDVYLDGDGVSTEAELLHRWRTEERLPGAFLDRYRPDACRARHIPGASPVETFALARHLLECGACDLLGAAGLTPPHGSHVPSGHDADEIRLSSSLGKRPPPPLTSPAERPPRRGAKPFGSLREPQQRAAGRLSGMAPGAARLRARQEVA